MMAELARKRKVRAGDQASTTRILGQIDPAVTTGPLEVPNIIQLRRSLKDKLTSLTALLYIALCRLRGPNYIHVDLWVLHVASHTEDPQVHMYHRVGRLYK